MRIFSPMTYFFPYVSGPIVHADIVGRELVERGHSVSFLTTQHQPDLPLNETLDTGVQVVRTKVVGGISRGKISPGFLAAARREMAGADLVWVHVPQLEAPALVEMARRMSKPTVSTCHTDLVLPPGLPNRVIDNVLRAGHRLAFARSDAITSYTQGYAAFSPMLRRHLDKVEVIPPPIEIESAAAAHVAELRSRIGLGDRPALGICARLAAEKGFEQILASLPDLLDRYPDLCIVHAGETDAVPGERRYRETIEAMVEPWSDHWITAGVLRGADLGAFYAACDVLLLPSVNTTESFGIVQVESMLAGTPVVASALPGVSEPIERTGMGALVPPGDTNALVQTCLAVLDDLDAYTVPRSRIEEVYGLERTIDDYEALFTRLR
jgi:glycosyltransferase involved in cell wall biosynthesis